MDGRTDKCILGLGLLSHMWSIENCMLALSKRPIKEDLCSRGIITQPLQSCCAGKRETLLLHALPISAAGILINFYESASLGESGYIWQRGDCCIDQNRKLCKKQGKFPSDKNVQYLKISNSLK